MSGYRHKTLSLHTFKVTNHYHAADSQKEHTAIEKDHELTAASTVKLSVVMPLAKRAVGGSAMECVSASGAGSVTQLGIATVTQLNVGDITELD